MSRMPRGFALLYGCLMLVPALASPAAENATAGRWQSARAAYEALAVFEGVWAGSGEGKWGSSRVTNRFLSILAGKEICRAGTSVYPPQPGNENGETHESLALFGLVDEERQLVMTEYDSEGFVSRYRLDLDSSRANESWVFELERGDNLPSGMRARMRLNAPHGDGFTETFELDFGARGYELYLANQLQRVAIFAPPGCAVNPLSATQSD